MFRRRVTVSGSVRGAFGVRSGSVRGLVRVRSGCVPGPFGVCSGSVRDPFEVRLESVWVHGIRSVPFAIRLRSERKKLKCTCFEIFSETPLRQPGFLMNGFNFPWKETLPFWKGQGRPINHWSASKPTSTNVKRNNTGKSKKRRVRAPDA